MTSFCSSSSLPKRERALAMRPNGTLFTHNRAVWGTLLHAVTNLDADVLITIGHDTSDAIFDGASDSVLVRRFVPQAQVLSRAAALVCHDGFNTLIGALRAGVPSVCLPLNADQPFNAAACAAAGAGVNLAHSARDSRGPIIDPAALTAHEVQYAVKRFWPTRASAPQRKPWARRSGTCHALTTPRSRSNSG
jgi:UDP-N-acetylglucosamine:LPS N-acetylglucosamine transferase